VLRVLQGIRQASGLRRRRAGGATPGLGFEHGRVAQGRGATNPGPAHRDSGQPRHRGLVWIHALGPAESRRELARLERDSEVQHTLAPVGAPARARAKSLGGDPCKADAECSFAHEGESAFCFVFPDDERGFCSLPCEGYCPDQTGRATSFSTILPGTPSGGCVARSESENGYCAAIPGTSAQQANRYLGSSGAPTDSTTVCLP
jgi:hypothetical protein